MQQISSIQEKHLKLAQSSLKQSLSRYQDFYSQTKSNPSEALQQSREKEIEALQEALDKLEQKVFAISTFGIVSCGKSSIINTLVGEEVFFTGALNGSTTTMQSTRWKPADEDIEIELIDTPGIDEVEGEARANMARVVAQKSDLILFVLAGDITKTEYLVLQELRKSQKPIVIVFNKVDLYPQKDRQSIVKKLQSLNAANQGEPEEINSESADSDLSSSESLEQFLVDNEIVMISAKPRDIQVRTETADGTVTTTWESPPPQIEELQAAITKIIHKEGVSLLALNALVQARDAEHSMARNNINLQSQSTQEIIWNYAKYKALIVAANPFPIFDVFGGFCVDLALIRARAKFYNLPLTNYETRSLWRQIIASSGGLLIGEIVSTLALGIGKGGSAIVTAFSGFGAFGAYMGAAGIQSAIAGYTSYIIGKVAQVYLEKGCSWGKLGASTVISEIVAQVEPNTIIYRLQQEL